MEEDELYKWRLIAIIRSKHIREDGIKGGETRGGYYVVISVGPLEYRRYKNKGHS